MTKWHLITDGSCLGNPGKGGWAFILTNEEIETIKSGYEETTTNNRMELQALISGLKLFASKYDNPLTVTMDSQYILNGIKSWMANWKKNNWKTSAKTAVKNQDLWQELDKTMNNMKLSFNWTRGHNGHILHDRVDVIARCAATQHARCQCA
ncbi:ribonuclease HI [Candidatus Cytomitobacter primus]|uniref:Ribonuclease H n=1 Tax=Candidatus Cytomitobacter primus TaxID=2066024 RepID=A0A5C0UF83_9PROT|nr:ribonuclease HI [Candidatus Cytomitobacter primus]QEK38766.1 ribonuclease HI [Candidatus Cytomitobacter primus]